MTSVTYYYIIKTYKAGDWKATFRITNKVLDETWICEKLKNKNDIFKFIFNDYIIDNKIEIKVEIKI